MFLLGDFLPVQKGQTTLGLTKVHNFGDGEGSCGINKLYGWKSHALNTSIVDVLDGNNADFLTSHQPTNQPINQPTYRLWPTLIGPGF